MDRPPGRLAALILTVSGQAADILAARHGSEELEAGIGVRGAVMSQMMIEKEPCYIYYIIPYKENRKILKVLTPSYGPVSVMAYMSRESEGLFQPFVPLKLTCEKGGHSDSDLFFLKDYEFCGSGFSFKMPDFCCAFYLNELLYHLYRGQEPNPGLFALYACTLDAIARKDRIEFHLRCFELELLSCLGYGLSTRDESGNLLKADTFYRFCHGIGFVPTAGVSSARRQFRAHEQAPISSRKAVGAYVPLAKQLQRTRYETVEPGSAPTAPMGAVSAPAPIPVPVPAPDDSGLLFAKSRVKGPRMSDRPAAPMGFFQYGSPDSCSEYGSADFKGTADSGYFNQYRDFLGPELTGRQIGDILSLELRLPQALAHAKQLTSALIQRLLHGKELCSRKLYQEYVQSQKQAAQASAATANAATAAAVPATARAAEQPGQAAAGSDAVEDQPRKGQIYFPPQTVPALETTTRVTADKSSGETAVLATDNQETAVTALSNVKVSPDLSRLSGTAVISAAIGQSEPTMATHEVPKSFTALTSDSTVTSWLETMGITAGNGHDIELCAAAAAKTEETAAFSAVATEVMPEVDKVTKTTAAKSAKVAQIVVPAEVVSGAAAGAAVSADADAADAAAGAAVGAADRSGEYSAHLNGNSISAAEALDTEEVFELMPQHFNELKIPEAEEPESKAAGAVKKSAAAKSPVRSESGAASAADDFELEHFELKPLSALEAQALADTAAAAWAADAAAEAEADEISEIESEPFDLQPLTALEAQALADAAKVDIFSWSNDNGGRNSHGRSSAFGLTEQEAAAARAFCGMLIQDPDDSATGTSKEAAAALTFSSDAAAAAALEPDTAPTAPDKAVPEEVRAEARSMGLIAALEAEEATAAVVSPDEEKTGEGKRSHKVRGKAKASDKNAAESVVLKKEASEVAEGQVRGAKAGAHKLAPDKNQSTDADGDDEFDLKPIVASELGATAVYDDSMLKFLDASM